MIKELFYKDTNGNKIYRRYIQSRGKYQLAGYNKQGKLLTETATINILKKAGSKIKKIR